MGERYRSIDLLRGIAIIAMIQGHILEYFITPPTGFAATLHHSLFGPFGGYAAPLFILIAGFSSYLYAQNLQKLQEGEKPLYIRGFLLLCLATLISMGGSLLENPGEIKIVGWGPIQLIGICLLLLPLFKRLHVLIQLFLVSLAAGVWVHIPSHIPLLTDGFSPILPWGALFFCGYLLSVLYFALYRLVHNRAGVLFIACGLSILLILYWLTPTRNEPFEWAHRSAPTSASLLGFTGLFIVLVAVAGYSLDKRRVDHWIIRSVSGFGRRALTIYYAQLIGIVMGARLLTWISGQPLDLPWLWFIPLTVCFLLCLHILMNVYWKTRDYTYSLEWFLADLVSRVRAI